MNGFAEELPPTLSNIGQACYQCFMGESELNPNDCVTALQRCSGCFRVSYCGSGEFSFEYTGSMLMRNVTCTSLSKGENHRHLAFFFASDEYET